MSKRLKTLWPLMTLLVLSACVPGSTVAVARVSDYCKVAAPISYDRSVDSEATVAGVEAHNSVYVCVCEGDCPNPTLRRPPLASPQGQNDSR
jgi:hypothetical protein